MNSKHQDDLIHIRQMMERSSRFMSLSGLSGVAAGMVALIAAFVVYYLLKGNGIDYFDADYINVPFKLFVQLLGIALLTIFVAAGLAYFFTWKKGKHIKQRVWTPQSKRMLLHLIIPLKVGGVFCFALACHHLWVWVAPATLLFYGLSLISCSKFTYGDILYLGIVQVILGLIGVFFLGYGLVFWAIGFGVMHIIYGVWMYFKYDKL